MIQMIQMNQFVENHIVPDEARHLYQAPVQRDGTGAGAGAPARFLVPDAHLPGGEPMALGQVEGGLHEFNLGQAEEDVFRRVTRAQPRFAWERGQLIGETGQTPICDHRADRNPPPPEQHRSRRWARVVRQEGALKPQGQELFFHPRIILRNEAKRLLPGAAPGNGDPEHQFWEKSDDVALGAFVSDALQRQPGLANDHPCFRDGAFSTVGLQKGVQKIQLHAGQSKDVTLRLQERQCALSLCYDSRLHASAV